MYTIMGDKLHKAYPLILSPTLTETGLQTEKAQRK